MRIKIYLVPLIAAGAIFLSSCKKNAITLSFTNAKGEVPQLGNLIFRFSSSLAKDMKIGSPGYRITRMYPDSPLAKAGAKVGDLLISLDGQKLKPANDVATEPFHQAVRDVVPESNVVFEAIRDTKPMTFKLSFLPSPISSAPAL